MTQLATSVVVDGKVDTSKTVSPESASGRGGPKQWFAAETTPSDPTQDPDWATFERVHTESAVPESPGLREVQQFIQRTSGAPLPAEARITGHPAATKAGPAGQALPGDILAPTEAAKPAQQQPAQAKPDAEQRTRAIAALKRDGWKDTSISKLPDADLLEIGLARASSQEEVDTKFSEFRTRLGEAKPAKSEPAPAQATREKEATPASGGPGQTASPTLDDVVKQAVQPVARAFADQWGEEIGEPVGTAMEQALRGFAAPIVQENQKLMRGLEALAGMVEGMVRETVHERWSKDYPQVQDPATSAAIEKAYDSLIQTGRYDMGPSGIREALEHARRIVMPGVQPASVQAQRAAEALEYDQGARQQPVLGARAPAAAGTKSDDAVLWSAFEQAERMSASANNALYGRA